jgi:hypothetical protein
MFLSFDFSDSSLILETSDVIYLCYELNGTTGLLSVALSSSEAALEVAQINPLDADQVFQKLRNYVTCWELQSGNCRRLIPVATTRLVQFNGSTVLLTCGNQEKMLTLSLSGDTLEKTMEIYNTVKNRLHAL